MKNGFTLVELLAVIVILSAIVLITRPVILNIMNEGKSGVVLRSAESYLTVVEDSLTEYVVNNSGISNGTYYIMSNGDICLGDLNDTNCSSDVVKINVSQDAPNEGIIIYENQTVKEILFVYNGKTITKNNSGKLIFTEISKPYLADSLVPVVYNGTNWVVASEENWYNYLFQEWANAVILKNGITKEVGDVVTVEGTDPEVLAMYVWIPRYEYKIEDKYGRNGINSNLPGEIDINFISKKQVTPSEGYTIHPAFTFGNKELSGIWVGKFELSHTSLSNSTTNNNLECSNEKCTTSDNLRILPNRKSLRYNNVSNFFYAIRSMNRTGNYFGFDSSKLDVHMVKNSEWGAVAYLSQSKFGKYGNNYYSANDKEIYLNNSSSFYTGRSAGASNASYTSVGNYEYHSGQSLSLETNNVKFNIVNDSAYPWDFINGLYSSTNKTHNSTSNLSLSLSLKNSGTLSFEWAVSGEVCCDYTYYTIKKDGEVLSGTGTSTSIKNASTTLNYISVTKTLEPGNYEIIYSYIKDGSVDSGLDTAYVKNIKVHEVSNKMFVEPQTGVGASTTGNITGIYDMNGGSWEYVMGVFADSSGNIFTGDTSDNSSGFSGKLGSSTSSYSGVSFPDAKYFDLYKASSGTTININNACDKEICYGHSLNETSNWYGDYKNFVSNKKPWLVRSGGYSDNSASGVFYYSSNVGKALSTYSTRPVIVPIN